VADIEDQIAEAKSEGYSVDGVLYAEANQKKIADLQKQLDKENTEYQKQRDRKKSQYDQDVADAQDSHNQKLTQLQQSLAEENAILEKHRADVAAIGEAQKEDDISRLKRQFAESNAEAAKDHADKLAKIRSNGTALGSAYVTGIADGAKGAQKTLDQQIREATASGGLQFASAGKTSAQGMWDNFKSTLVSNFKNFGNVLYDTIQANFEGDAGKRFSLLLNAVPIIGPALSAMASTLNRLPKRAGGGSVSAGQPYWVGDNPDGSLNDTSELFVPGQSGTIINQRQLAGVAGGGQAVTININNPVYYTPEDAARLAKDIGFRLSLL
jgi:hypothetical protein